MALTHGIRLRHFVHGSRLRLLAMATVQGIRPRHSHIASALALPVTLSLDPGHCHKKRFLSARVQKLGGQSPPPDPPCGQR